MPYSSVTIIFSKNRPIENQGTKQVFNHFHIKQCLFIFILINKRLHPQMIPGPLEGVWGGGAFSFSILVIERLSKKCWRGSHFFQGRFLLGGWRYPPPQPFHDLCEATGLWKTISVQRLARSFCIARQTNKHLDIYFYIGIYYHFKNQPESQINNYKLSFAYFRLGVRSSIYEFE